MYSGRFFCKYLRDKQFDIFTVITIFIYSGTIIIDNLKRSEYSYMCGILGTMPGTERNIFKHALDTLVHRGPDDFGIEAINNEITLGHRRLSIVDINHGHQPMFDSEERYSVIFNGEIYTKN